MSWPNRSLCDVLEEMRTCDKTKNYSYLKGLIEEVQTMGNRMEAALCDFKDMENSHEQKKEAEKELVKVKKELKKVTETLDEMRD